MKNLILLSSMLMLFASCFKSKSKLLYTMSATYDSTDVTFTTVRVHVTKTGGDDDIVNLSIEGLPSYITAEISPISERTPFDAVIRFEMGPSTQKDILKWTYYPITIKGRSNGDVTRSAEVTFFYNPTEPAQVFDREFWVHSQCSQSGNGTSNIYPLVRNGREITFVDFYSDMSGTYSVKATVDGKAKTLTIPSVTLGAYTFRGTGVFKAVGHDSMECTIHYSRSTVSTFDTCTSVLTVGN